MALRGGGFDGVDLGVQALERQRGLRKSTITGTRTLKRGPIITTISRPLFTKDVGASGLAARERSKHHLQCQAIRR